ncbi:MAG: NAD(P)/FAD-dependent oxidoreductase [Faecousia sp.]
MVLFIIGGGASGLAAAIAASRNPACEVHIFERQNRVGRKLLATGNGRCNLSNAHVSPAHYHGGEPEFVVPSLTAFGFENTMNFFRKLGLYTIQEDSGKVYPWSDQAGSVVDVLRFALLRPNIHLHTGFEIRKIQRLDKGFRVTGAEESHDCQRLIVACGGLAGTALGGSMSGYQLLRGLGHKCSRLRPSLVQLKSGYPRCASLKGIRATCGITITCDGKPVAQNHGEVQFTQYGISGPAIFEISRHACTGPGRWVCQLDLLPELTEDRILALLQARQQACPELEAGELLTGTVHNRLGKVLTQEAGISLTEAAGAVRQNELERLAAQCKALYLELTEPMGMDSAQVTAGGILTRDFDPETMESRLCPGLYACGEVLDIDGDCGGYNLQWAWSSGRAAGTAAGRTEP